MRIQLGAVLFCALAATAALADPAASTKKAAPRWPEGAVLQLDLNLALWMAPTDNAADVEKRRKKVGVTLNWPAAVAEGGVARYRIKKDGVVLKVLDGSTLQFDFEPLLKSVAGKYQVEAGDRGGRWSAPIEARVAPEELKPTGLQDVLPGSGPSVGGGKTAH